LVAYLGGKALEERELDRLTFEAGRSYDFRLAALVRDLRGHRSMLRRYVTAHLNATQARSDQLPAATHALREAYNDAWELLGNRIAPRACETPVPRGVDRRVGERRSTIERRCGERRCPERAHVGRRVLFATDRRMVGRRMGEPRAFKPA
jgi:hypothetical protein